MSRSPRRILAVKLADIGDALLVTPALRALREAHPEARLDVLTTPQSEVVFRHGGLVDEVLLFRKERWDHPLAALSRPIAPLRLGRDLRARRYDAVALFHPLSTRFGALKHAALVRSTGAPLRAGLARPGSPRAWFLNRRAVDRGYGAWHVVEAGLAVAEALGARATRSDLAFRPGVAAEAQAEALVTGLPRGDGPLAGRMVALHPGAGAFSAARRWRPEGFAAVADGLARQGATVLLVGREGDGCSATRAAAKEPLRDLSDRTDLPTLAALLARCDLLVGNDSGVSHVASAMDTPVLAVFGPSEERSWGPWWPRERRAPTPHRVVSLNLPCRPCFYRGHAIGSPRGCATRDCLAWLPASRVLDAAREMLGEPRREGPRGAGADADAAADGQAQEKLEGLGQGREGDAARAAGPPVPGSGSERDG